MKGIFIGIVGGSGDSGGSYTSLNGFYLPTSSINTWCDSTPTTVYVPTGEATSIDDAKNKGTIIYSNSSLITKALIGYYGSSKSSNNTGSLWEPEGGGTGRWTINNTQSCTG